MHTGARIDYKTLRRINAEAARRAVLEYLASCGHNIAATARVFGITRPVVYDILAKQLQGNLADRPQAPQRQPRKTPAAVEERVIAARNRTRLGAPSAWPSTWPHTVDDLLAAPPRRYRHHRLHRRPRRGVRG